VQDAERDPLPGVARHQREVALQGGFGLVVVAGLEQDGGLALQAPVQVGPQGQSAVVQLDRGCVVPHLLVHERQVGDQRLVVGVHRDRRLEGRAGLLQVAGARQHHAEHADQPRGFGELLQ
jgi:hypothetical protein